MMKKTFAVAMLMALGGTALAQVQVTTNFSKWVEYPLMKKIGVYQTPLTCEKWLQRDLPKMAQIEARSLRYEFAWGKDLYGSDAISGSATKPVCNLSKADFLFDKARENTQAFVFAHGYMPSFLQSQTGGLGWQSTPNNYEGWQKVNSMAAAHWKKKGYSNRYVEVWNEPDLPGGFFSGTEDDYMRIYHYAALGAKEGDADCKVGGPAIAFMTWWHDHLVEYAKQHSLPLDFLSGHAYGADFRWELDAMRNALNNLGNNEAEMLLTEYSPYPAAEYAANGPVERAEAAMTFFEALPTMMEYPDLTYVTWAQYIDPEEGNTGHAYANWDKLGLVDGNNGCRKALFNAFRLYGMMPANRCEISTGTLRGMSSADDGHVATVIWNTTDKGRKVRLRMTHIPFQEGIVETYHIDKTHNSWYENANDELLPTLVSREKITNGVYTLTDSVRDQGVFFVRISAPDAAPSFPANHFAKLVKTQQWFPSRSNAAPYAQFDSKTWTAYLSMNTLNNGWAVTSVTAEDLPQRFTVKCKDSGNLLNTNKNAALCLRIDFQSQDGEYHSSVLFHGGIYHDDRAYVIPWGTKQLPEKVVEVPDFKEFVVDLKQYQPKDFSGRAIITFDMSSTGANRKANIQLLSDERPSLSAVQVDSLSEGTVKLSVLMSGNKQPVSEAGFVLAVDNDPLNLSTAKSYPAEVDGGRITATITGLAALKNYHVRGFVDGQYTSENAFFTTKLATVVTSIIRANAEKLTATINGNVSSENGSEVIERGFLWCEGDEQTEPTFQDHVIKVGKGRGTFKYTLEELLPETDYAVRAYAINRAGIAYGRTKTFTTKEETDAIETVQEGEDARPSEAIYDLTGKRLVKNGKGKNICIKKGKKFLN